MKTPIISKSLGVDEETGLDKIVEAYKINIDSDQELVEVSIREVYLSPTGKRIRVITNSYSISNQYAINYAIGEEITPPVFYAIGEIIVPEVLYQPGEIITPAYVSKNGDPVSDAVIAIGGEIKTAAVISTGKEIKIPAIIATGNEIKIPANMAFDNLRLQDVSKMITGMVDNDLTKMYSL